MQYDVEISELAETQYEKFLHYLHSNLKNEQAVLNLMNDFDDSVAILEESAGNFEYCKCERLKVKGLHKLRFRHHRYIFVYRILNNNKVIVEGMYHELQDYENAIE
jgi:plasmid stabilization system protein ParE